MQFFFGFEGSILGSKYTKEKTFRFQIEAVTEKMS